MDEENSIHNAPRRDTVQRTKKIQGWCDAPLTQVGYQQANVAALYFKDQHIEFDHAYASTSERACDTLECITKMPYTRSKGLKEWNFRLFEGEREALNPSLPYGDFFQHYGGESELEVRQRIRTTLVDIMKQVDHKSVLVVSHGAAIAQFYREWESYAKVMKKERFHNCCILKYEYEDEIFILTDIIQHNVQTLKT